MDRSINIIHSELLIYPDADAHYHMPPKLLVTLVSSDPKARLGQTKIHQWMVDSEKHSGYVIICHCRSGFISPAVMEFVWNLHTEFPGLKVSAQNQSTLT